ncbi:MAG: hypothetical protein HQ567_08315 [Candidatus Nealsonbacteria bacterium]|nr:hypothetical protein [Candidatus Nealsonbacteria bacterium]
MPTREGVVGTLFDPEICGSWLYKSNPMAITTPGPEGALPTVRFQMLREGVQETEVRIFLVQSLDRLPEPRRQQLRRLLDEWVGARRVARVLSGAQVSLDGQRLTSRMIAAAAEIAGEQSPARWETPPEVVSSLFDAE